MRFLQRLFSSKVGGKAFPVKPTVNVSNAEALLQNEKERQQKIVKEQRAHKQPKDMTPLITSVLAQNKKHYSTSDGTSRVCKDLQDVVCRYRVLQSQEDLVSGYVALMQKVERETRAKRDGLFDKSITASEPKQNNAPTLGKTK